jgi:phosphoribosyl 1,2-cyclic phosphodiesterase
VRVALLGVRGSTPAPGGRFVRYGGHTSCVAVLPDGQDVPALVLDAGTGLRELPALTGGEPFRGTVWLTHLHWDHLQGLPFCRVLDHPEAELELFLPVDGDAAPEDVLARGFSPPHFPIGPSGLQGGWRFTAVPRRWDGPGGLTVRTATVRHKGGVTVGVRVEQDGAALAYLPDHALTPGAPDPAAERLARGVDLLLHDGQYTGTEEATARAYGHATIETVLDLADRCEVGRLLLTHHDPGRSDDELDALAARYRHTPQGRPVSFAVQGAEWPVGRPMITADAPEPALEAHLLGRER